MKKKHQLVSPSMTSAGVEIMDACLVASATKALNGLGGGPTWKSWLKQYKGRNKDLVIQYANHKLRAVDACYIAMHREAIAQLVKEYRQ